MIRFNFFLPLYTFEISLYKLFFLQSKVLASYKTINIRKYLYILLSVVFCKKIMSKRKQLNIRLNEELHKQAKVVAILKGNTLNDYIEDAIKKALEKDKSLVEKIKK